VELKQEFQFWCGRRNQTLLQRPLLFSSGCFDAAEFVFRASARKNTRQCLGLCLYVCFCCLRKVAFGTLRLVFIDAFGAV
jgi:hypothetical protein